MKLVARGLGGLLFLFAIITAQITQPVRAQTVGVASADYVSRLASSLRGRWLGSLEYRDYQSNTRVSLPTLLDVTTDTNGSLALAYTFDDGNGKIVREHEIVHIDSVAATYVVTNEDKSSDPYSIASVNPFDVAGKTQVVLLGHGTDNDRPAEVRETLTITPKAMTMLREVRAAGGEYLFRHRYAFSRLQ